MGLRDANMSPEDSHRKIRVISVCAATLIALSSGTNYAYSAWAPQFAERLHLSATQSNLIGNFGNIGMYAMGIPGGILIDSRGPRWGVCAGLIALACGYFPLRSAYVAAGEGYSTTSLCFFALMSGIGSCTAFSAALKVSASNWPNHRGTATAFPLSAFGLSAFFYTAMSGYFFPNDTSGLLLLLAVGTVGMIFIGMFFLQIIRPNSPYEALPTDERPALARKDSNRMRRTSTHSRHSSKDRNGEGAAEETSPLNSPTHSSSPGDLDDDPKHPHEHTNSHIKPDITGFRLLQTPKFWQLFVMLGLLCGVGLMTINNIGNNARSLWYHFDDTASHDFIHQRQLIHVSILSLCSFLGRLGSGIGSDWLIHHRASRFWTLVTSATLFCLAQVVALTLENPNQLFWLSGLTGLAYGALFGVYPALVADAFGPSGMGINWGAMTMAPVLSGNVFNLAYGKILDQHSYYEGDGQGGGERLCREGRACYSSAYWITLVSSVIAVFWSLWCIRQERLEKLKDGRESKGRAHEG
ncbi:putative MFS transporter [Hortaea werneckii]|nr:putative MFS transporter [Hortaea werneckii]